MSPWTSMNGSWRIIKTRRIQEQSRLCKETVERLEKIKRMQGGK